jgi:hypothetical protein
LEKVKLILSRFLPWQFNFYVKRFSIGAMPPHIGFALFTDGNSTAIHGEKIADRVIYGKAPMLAESNDDFIL